MEKLRTEVFEGNHLLDYCPYKEDDPHFMLVGNNCTDGRNMLIPVGEQMLSRHMLLLGGIGTGKSNAFNFLIRNVLHDKTEQVFTMNLAHFQQMIEEQLGREAMTFIRIGKQLIVNRAHIFKINPNKQQLIMSNMDVNIAFDLQASKEALKQLKALIESETGKEAKL